MKKQLLVGMILVLTLAACGQTAAPVTFAPTAPSLPTTYQGAPLPTPPPRAENEPLPPAWLIVQDKVVPGTLFGYHLSNGQELWGPPAQEVGLAMATFVVDEQVVIVAPTSVTAFQSRLVIDALAGPTARYLKAEGKTEGDAAVFTLEQTGYTDGQFLLGAP